MLRPARHRRWPRRGQPPHLAGADYAAPPLLLGTPTQALAAPSELHPAGRHPALTPPYPAYRPLLQFFERWFQRCNRGYVVVAEPSSDTPVVMPPGMLSGLPGQAQACMPQAASSLNPHRPARWGFSVPTLFSRDRRRERPQEGAGKLTTPSDSQDASTSLSLTLGGAFWREGIGRGLVRSARSRGWRWHHPLIPTVASSHAVQSSGQVIKPEA
jgi:hypothetical protein